MIASGEPSPRRPHSNRPALLGITLGDPLGIGPEIVLKLHQRSLPCASVVYGDVGILRQTAQTLGLNVPIEAIQSLDQRPTTTSLAPSNTSPLYVLQAGAVLDRALPIGHVHAAAGQAAYDALNLAIDHALAGQIDGIVTAPLSKEAMHLAGVPFPGHTEVLAHRCGDVPVAMVLVNPQIRVILATIHMSIAQVPNALTVDLELQTIEMAHRVCQQLGIARPRVAVAGLNPHAGESGRFGQEEIQIIEPAIAAAQARGIHASGPWPGDTIFMRARQGEFDIVVAQYHDQGLIPIKYLGIDEGVNMTAGLPIIRTSVDHGTAFDIAGQGIAQADSLACAFDLAYDLIAR